MNTSLAAAFTALGNSANPNTALATPFKDIGPWFKVATYLIPMEMIQEMAVKHNMQLVLTTKFEV